MKQNTFQKKMDDIRKKAINATATVIAAPKILKSKRVQGMANSEVAAIKAARGYKDAPMNNPDRRHAERVADFAKENIIKRTKKLNTKGGVVIKAEDDVTKGSGDIRRIDGKLYHFPTKPSKK
jgi:hypothetical protein